MNLKELRTRMSMTQKQLADQMDTTQQTVARWESGKASPNVEQIKDLCVVLQCTADDLLGSVTAPQEVRFSPFSAGDTGQPYGSLIVSLKTGTHEYPIDETARKAADTQLDDLRIMGREKSAADWLHLWTLDNRVLLINPVGIRSIQIVAKNLQPMPDFKMPEVYRALAEWIDVPTTGILAKECRKVIAALGEDEAISMASDIRVTFLGGETFRCALSEEVATEVYAIIIHGGEVPAGTMMLAKDEERGLDQIFVNLDDVAMIEVPGDLYYRLTADDDDDD